MLLQKVYYQKGQYKITLPKQFCDSMAFKPNSEIEIEIIDNRSLKVTKH